ncbi:MAG: hypothetical protein HIU83_17490 [Proteobacteria bacterium]|nr:hypothetical protein [Pseudomonadota bacterium]
MTPQQFKDKIATIYSAANELGRDYGISTCTPDGHLLGAIGQIAAKIAFGLEFGSSKTEHNATITKGAKKVHVQVRSTGRGTIALREEPEYLISLNISNNGEIGLLYNGPGKHVWNLIEHQKNIQKYASQNQLAEAQHHVPPDQILLIKENILSNHRSN